jgi:hypothetical protein
MENSVSDLAQLYQKIDEVFSPAQLGDAVREAAVRDFSNYAVENNLSLDQAIMALCDPKRVREHIAVAREAVQIEEATQPSAPLSVQTAELIKLFLEKVTVALEQTNKDLGDIEEISVKTNESMQKSEKLLEEVHGAAKELMKSVAEAGETTKKIVGRLEDVSTKVEEQITKLETITEKVKKVDHQTSPEETRKTNLKYMLGGAIAGTVLSTFVSAVSNHVPVPETPPQPAPMIVVVPVPASSPPPCPLAEEGKKGFVLKDVTTGKEYRFNQVIEKQKGVKKARKPGLLKRHRTKIVRHP